MAFMTNKEQANMELLIKLREEGTITTPRLLFKQSRPRRSKDSLQEVYSNSSNMTCHSMLVFVSLTPD
jgi:hypothetical protein